MIFSLSTAIQEPDILVDLFKIDDTLSFKYPDGNLLLKIINHRIIVVRKVIDDYLFLSGSTIQYSLTPAVIYF